MTVSELRKIQLFQLRLSPKQSGKVENERERLLNSLIYQRFPAAFRAHIRLFHFARGTTLIEMAVYQTGTVCTSAGSTNVKLLC